MIDLQGVGLLLFAENTQRILFLRELRAKPSLQKEAGMLSFPLETVEKGETKEQAMERLLWEEMGILPSCLSSFPKFFGGRMEILSGVAYTLPSYAFCQKEFVSQPQDNDIEFYGWVSLEEILKEKLFLRVEVIPVIRQFFKEVI